MKKIIQNSHYLEERLFFCLKSLLGELLPSHNFKSIHDLFNSELFDQFLFKILSQQIKMTINEYSPIKKNKINLQFHQNQTYDQMNIQNFTRINQIIKKSHNALEIQLKQQINQTQIKKMVQKYDIQILQKFIQNVFELMIRNQKIVMFITTLSQEDQSQIKDFLQLSTQKNQQNIEASSQTNQLQLESRLLDSNSLISIQQVESHLQAKQQEIKQERLLKMQLQQEIQQLKTQLLHKQSQIENYKKRLVNYEEIDQLLLQKDEEILSLNKRLTQTQVRSKTKQSEFISNRNKLNQKLAQVQSKSQQFQHMYEKQKNQFHELIIQKQQSLTSMKKVIANLKQKNKLFSDKINQIQRQLIEINFQKQLKEKQLQDLKQKFQGASKSIQNGQYLQNRDRDGFQGFDYQTRVQQPFSGLISPRSDIQYNKNKDREYRNSNSNKLGEQIQISEIQKQNFEQQLSLYTKDESNKNARLVQLLQQNQNLKRQIQQFNSEKNKSANQGLKQFKELSDQYQKLKKRLNIMKRRNQQLDLQRKEEIQIMVGAIQEYVKIKV